MRNDTHKGLLDTRIKSAQALLAKAMQMSENSVYITAKGRKIRKGMMQYLVIRLVEGLKTGRFYF